MKSKSDLQLMNSPLLNSENQSELTVNSITSGCTSLPSKDAAKPLSIPQKLPLTRLPGWATWIPLDVSPRFAMPVESLVLAAITISAGLVGKGLQLQGLSGQIYSPVIHTLMVLGPSPLARSPLSYLIFPIQETMAKAQQLAQQPRLRSRDTLSANENAFGVSANPANPMAPVKTIWDEIVPNPALACGSAHLPQLQRMASYSVDRTLILNGTDPLFVPDLLDLRNEDWKKLIRLISGSFFQGRPLPGDLNFDLTALWPVLPDELIEVWSRCKRRSPGRPFPPFVVIDAGQEGGELQNDLQPSAERMEQWRKWCHHLLQYRYQKNQSILTFGQRGIDCLTAFHNECVRVEREDPLARASGVTHFVFIAERIAALFSIGDNEPEIRTGKVALAVEVARYYRQQHIAALSGMLGSSIPSPRSPLTQKPSVEQEVLQKLMMSGHGMTVRELSRRFHRGPDSGTLRLILQRLEVSGQIQWDGNQVVGVSAPTNAAGENAEEEVATDKLTD